MTAAAAEEDRVTTVKNVCVTYERLHFVCFSILEQMHQWKM